MRTGKNISLASVQPIQFLKDRCLECGWEDIEDSAMEVTQFIIINTDCDIVWRLCYLGKEKCASCGNETENS